MSRPESSHLPPEQRHLSQEIEGRVVEPADIDDATFTDIARLTGAELAFDDTNGTVTIHSDQFQIGATFDAKDERGTLTGLRVRIRKLSPNGPSQETEPEELIYTQPTISIRPGIPRVQISEEKQVLVPINTPRLEMEALLHGAEITNGHAIQVQRKTTTIDRRRVKQQAYVGFVPYSGARPGN